MAIGTKSPSNANKNSSAQPTWWSDDLSSGWSRVREAMERDWEQTRHDLGDRRARDIDQNVDDTVRQAAGTQDIPPEGVANEDGMHQKPLRVSDDRDRYTEALRYGYGAANAGVYTDHRAWDDKLESKLREEWDDLKSGRTWDEVKDAVRSSFERARRAVRG